MEQLTAGLRESRLRLELALRGSDLGLWDWNIPSGRVDFSERWAEMLGYSLDEIEPIMAIWERLTYPNDWPAVHAVLDLHFRGETSSYECEHRRRHKDGHWVWIQERGKVVERSADGAPIRATGTHLDITEGKRAEEKIKSQLEELQRWQDVMLGREDRLQELKREANGLRRRLGEPIRSPSQEVVGVENPEA